MGSNRGGIEPSFEALAALGGRRSFEKRVAARRRKKRKREATIESRAVDYAESMGWTSRKMNGLGFVHWPDRLFIPDRVHGNRVERKRLLARRPFWVEFKRPGESPTRGQAQMHRDLRGRGETVYVVDDYEEFRLALNTHHAGLDNAGLG